MEQRIWMVSIAVGADQQLELPGRVVQLRAGLRRYHDRTHWLSDLFRRFVRRLRLRAPECTEKTRAKSTRHELSWHLPSWFGFAHVHRSPGYAGECG